MQQPEDYEDDIVQPPPFPGMNVTLAGLVERLGELKTWVTDQTVFATQAAQRFGHPQSILGSHVSLPKFPSEPDEYHSSLSAIALADCFYTMQNMRSLREAWDAVVRLYEDDWDSDKAVLARLNVLTAAISTLHSAVRTPEEWEAISEADKEKKKAFVKNLLKAGFSDPDQVLKDYDSARYRPSDN